MPLSGTRASMMVRQAKLKSTVGTIVSHNGLHLLFG
jgi:hypothetical protein